jgi:hypothetical protein
MRHRRSSLILSAKFDQNEKVRCKSDMLTLVQTRERKSPLRRKSLAGNEQRFMLKIDDRIWPEACYCLPAASPEGGTIR